ncbi:protein of unknown function [Magnetospira sp. QH-2]|nr:protein of unknown function [Magnetospira sp. QH-2]
MGRHLLGALGGRAFHRHQPAAEQALDDGRPYQAIIHCASNAAHDLTESDLPGFFEDHVGLTRALLGLPHERFVFLSTIDLYPRDDQRHHAEEAIAIDELKGPYAVAKALSEQHVRENGNAPLILRPASLIGPYARRSTLIRMALDPHPQVSLTADSTFGVVAHETVETFMKTCLDQGIAGTFNLAARGTLRLSELAIALNKDIAFGNISYRVPRLDTQPAQDLCPSLGASAMDVVMAFVQQMAGNRGEAVG